MRLSRESGQWVEGQSLVFVDQWSVQTSQGETVEVMAPGFGRTLYGLSSTFNDITSAEMGRLLIALAALAVLVLLGVIIARTRLGRVARPLLRFLQFVMGFAIVIAIWGTVINNPQFEHKRGLLDFSPHTIEELSHAIGKLLKRGLQGFLFRNLLATVLHISRTSLTEKLPKRETHAAGLLGVGHFFRWRHQHRNALGSPLLLHGQPVHVLHMLRQAAFADSVQAVQI